MKRIVIVGATSGLGRGLAEKFFADGWIVGVAGRNLKALEELRELAPERVKIRQIDILSENATEKLHSLIEDCGGMDIYLHCSGIAMLSDEPTLENEVRICETNAAGFTRMVFSAFDYFRETRRPGRLVAISSIAGVRGLEALPAYSASKAYDSTLLEALRQKSDGLKLPLRVVDIKPGWTRTPLLNQQRHYMWEMEADKVVDSIYEGVLNAKRVKVIGLRWKLMTTIERLVPTWLWTKLHIPLWK